LRVRLTAAAGQASGSHSRQNALCDQTLILLTHYIITPQNSKLHRFESQTTQSLDVLGVSLLLVNVRVCRYGFSFSFYQCDFVIRVLVTKPFLPTAGPLSLEVGVGHISFRLALKIRMEHDAP
jgi:hypothetical protein